MSGNRLKSAFFEGGWVTLSADFRGKGASPTNYSWYQSSRVIALSCGIKISAVRHLVLSQCTLVTDGQTDGRTDGQTDRITTPTTALAYARAVKINGMSYADDIVLIAASSEDLQKLLDKVYDVSCEFDLEITKTKQKFCLRNLLLAIPHSPVKNCVPLTVKALFNKCT